MNKIDVDGLSFSFPKEWTASKYDEWSFYRGQFGKMGDGIKAVDLMVLDLSKNLWFIEVKDYRNHPRTKTMDLAKEVQQKVFDTLAALLPAKVNGNDPTERSAAGDFLRAKKLRVVLHLEQPKKYSHLRPRAINPADIEKKLKIWLKPIDAHPLVTEKTEMRSLAWSVQ